MMNSLQSFIAKLSGGIAVEDNYTELRGLDGNKSLQDLMENAMGSNRKSRREASDYGVGLPPIA